jgi:hypothetical protein
MSDNAETTTEIKKLHDLNLQSVADDFSVLLTKHVGGVFEVTPTKMEHTHYGYGNDRVIFQFSVDDRSSIQRIWDHRDRVGFFAEPEAVNSEE